MGMMMSYDKKVLLETEGSILHGEYTTLAGPRKFLASHGVLEDVDYYPAEDVDELVQQAADSLASKLGPSCEVTVQETDVLVAALNLLEGQSDDVGEGETPVLVLNFANPFMAGGNKAIGINAQEGELCRRSTLSASLSSFEARPFYDANSDLGGSLYTNGVLVSPHVEVFRKPDYYTMDDPVVISVISAPAPYAHNLKDMSEADLLAALKARILGVLAVAADNGYRSLVLGAWGCGSNRNDPALVARAFHEALDQPLADSTFANLFDTVTFAITDPAQGASNLAAFRNEFDI